MSRQVYDPPMRCFPSVKQMMPTLLALKKDAKSLLDDEGDCIDVRLQVMQSGWTMWTGDNSYDTDHRGVWGASSVSGSDTRRTLIATANELLDQAYTQAAEQQSAKKS